MDIGLLDCGDAFFKGLELSFGFFNFLPIVMEASKSPLPPPVGRLVGGFERRDDDEIGIGRGGRAPPVGIGRAAAAAAAAAAARLGPLGRRCGGVAAAAAALLSLAVLLESNIGDGSTPAPIIF